MSTYTLYHNPRCSKSREALAILQKNNMEVIIVEYLKAPLALDALKKLSSHFNLKEFVRHNEPIFKELKLSLEDEDALLRAMVENPILMQRPIVTQEDKAIIARPPEKILSLLL